MLCIYLTGGQIIMVHVSSCYVRMYKIFISGSGIVQLCRNNIHEKWQENTKIVWPSDTTFNPPFTENKQPSA